MPGQRLQWEMRRTPMQSPSISSRSSMSELCALGSTRKGVPMRTRRSVKGANRYAAKKVEADQDKGGSGMMARRRVALFSASQERKT